MKEVERFAATTVNDHLLVEHVDDAVNRRCDGHNAVLHDREQHTEVC